MKGILKDKVYLHSLKLRKLAYCQAFCLAVIQMFELNTKSGVLYVLQYHLIQ